VEKYNIGMFQDDWRELF